MNRKTLKNIYREHLRQPTKKGAWYKKARSGKCPDDNPQISLFQVYLNEFGCFDNDQPFILKEKARSARNCTAERMADMRQLVENDEQADNNHIYPIKVAYALGKHCSLLKKNKYEYDIYINNFRKWYSELIKTNNGKQIHKLFSGNKNIQYPLEAYDIHTEPEFLSFTRKQHEDTVKSVQQNKESLHDWNKDNYSVYLPSSSNNNSSSSNINSSGSNSINLYTFSKIKKHIGGKTSRRVKRNSKNK